MVTDMLRLFIIAALVVQSIGSEPNCASGHNCKLCMEAGPPCVWCFDPKLNDRHHGRNYRCATLNVLMERGCSEDLTVQLKSQYSAPRNDSPMETKDTTIQLFPQTLDIKIRPRDKLTFHVGFKQALNYPVDLYYLTDMSFSMVKYLTAVSQQAQIIANTMRNLTNKFRMGFGTFVDKPVSPYIDIREAHLKNPCLLKKDKVKCESPYGYHHILRLSSDMETFQKVTNSTKPSGNVDGPEGGLDALAQVALCGSDIIGWNSDARKIVLFATDERFHMAGDGLLAGVVNRFDEKCHMQKKKDSEIYFYNMTKSMDYPSVGQIKNILSRKGIGVIFAITKDNKKLYDSLASALTSSAVGILSEGKNDNESDSIATLIRKNYAAISSTVALELATRQEEIKVKITPICPTNITLEGNACHSLPLGAQMSFKVEVSTDKCIDNMIEIPLYPTNLPSERIILKVKVACDCKGNCGETYKNSDRCSKGRGDLNCGICSCKEEYAGNFCECKRGENENSTASCTNKVDKKVCSGHGKCECGNCICRSDRYTGKFCECDSHNCPRANDDSSVCGGPTRGVCNCSKTCECKPGYMGEACDCLISQASCRGNGTIPTSITASNMSVAALDDGNSTEVLCSGHGTCDCGVCVCSDEWTGLTCSSPRGGEGRLCRHPEVRHCVLCYLAQHLKNDDIMDTSCTCQSKLVDKKKINFVDNRDLNEAASLCVMYDKEECRVYFMYMWEFLVRQERSLSINIQRQRQCPDRTSIILIVAAVILLIVLIGILLLILWKVCVTIHDRRAEADTLKVADQALFEAGENPIYLPPITTVHNPLCDSPDL